MGVDSGQRKKGREYIRLELKDYDIFLLILTEIDEEGDIRQFVQRVRYIYHDVVFSWNICYIL